MYNGTFLFGLIVHSKLHGMLMFPRDYVPFKWFVLSQVNMSVRHPYAEILFPFNTKKLHHNMTDMDDTVPNTV